MLESTQTVIIIIVVIMLVFGYLLSPETLVSPKTFTMFLTIYWGGKNLLCLCLCFSDEGYYQSGKFQFEIDVPEAYNMVVSSPASSPPTPPPPLLLNLWSDDLR